MKVKIIFRLVLTLVILSHLVIVQTSAQPLSSKDIDKLVKRSMKTFGVPGMAVALVKDGEVIHSKGYGVRSLDSKEKVDENTLFAIASNSKAFTTASIAILADRGKLKWDDRVIDYIPEFRLYHSYVTAEFTLRDLVTHRSGLGLGAGDLMFFPDGSDFTIKDVIHNLRYLKQTSGFRTKYDYDNLLYMVAGEVVARVTCMSWEAFVEKEIMQPLNMSHSACSYARLGDKSNVAEAHAPVDGKVKRIDRFTMNQGGAAAGGIYSNIVDMCKWIVMQMNRGRFGEDLEQALFTEKAHAEMWAPQTILSGRSGGSYNTHFAAYGLGWFLNDEAGYKKVTHTGGLPGMVTQVTLIPELNIGIIVFTNQQSGAAFSAITNQIKDAYFGIEDTDRVVEYYDRVQAGLDRAKKVTDRVWAEIEEQQEISKSRPLDVNPFLGSYIDNWFGEIVISLKDKKLWFDSKRSPKLTGEMFYYKGNTFIVKWNDRSMDADAFVMFQLDAEGNASGIKMKAVSPLTDFSYDFHDLDFRKVGE